MVAGEFLLGLTPFLNIQGTYSLALHWQIFCVFAGARMCVFGCAESSGAEWMAECTKVVSPVRLCAGNPVRNTWWSSGYLYAGRRACLWSVGLWSVDLHRDESTAVCVRQWSFLCAGERSFLKELELCATRHISHFHSALHYLKLLPSSFFRCTCIANCRNKSKCRPFTFAGHFVSPGLSRFMLFVKSTLYPHSEYTLVALNVD